MRDAGEGPRVSACESTGLGGVRFMPVDAIAGTGGVTGAI